MRIIRFVAIAFWAMLMLLAAPAQAGETVVYSYDPLGRLTSAVHSGTVNNGVTVGTTFDAADNRTQYTISGVPATGATFSINSASVTEGGNLVFTVTRGGTITTAVSVNYATNAGTALSPADFTAASGTLNFAANETSKTITVATIDDAAAESTETMTVVLSGASSGASITTATGTGTITDNDSTGATLSIGNASATEGGNLVFTVTRSGATASVVGASYATAGGSATSGTDFTAASGTVSFAAGETSKTITIATIDDSAVESAETMTVTLSAPTGGATITTATGTGTINDNDASGGGGILIPISYAASSSYGGYGYSGLSGTGAGMRDSDYSAVTSIHGTENEASAWIKMDLGSVQAIGNVVVVPANISAPGGWGSAYLNGAALERSDDESSWTAIGTVSSTADGVQVTVPVNTSARYVRLRKTNSYLGVGDFYATAGSAPSATLSIGAASVTEGGTLSFTVTRGGTTTTAVSASYATAGGTATSGSDFTAASGTVSFAAGETSKTITVVTIDDSAVESAETMTVTLSAPTGGATITTATGTGTITDNDSTGATLSIGNASATEGVALSFTVTRTGNTTTAVSASYATTSGTATSGSDFTAASGTVSFSAGETTKTISVSTIVDTVTEMAETMTVTLSEASSGATIGAATGTGTISDNAGEARISIGDASAIEGGNLAFTVTRSGNINSVVSVGYGTLAETATSDFDFTSITANSLTFAANETTKTITVVTIDDTAVESAETMTVNLFSPTNGAVIEDAVGTGTITDNDVVSATLAISNASVTEGGNLVFTVTRGGTTTTAVGASYTMSSGTASAGEDFTAASGTVSFAAGETSKTITVTTIDDSAVESAETMTVTLSAPTGGATITAATGTGTINDNDVSSATLSIGNASATEGGNLVFTVTRSGTTTSAVSASYASAGGTAATGSDFTAASGTVSFAAGETSKTITVATATDSTVEGSETMTVTLSSPSSGAVIGTAVGTGTINDPLAKVTIGNATITEGGVIVFTVNRSLVFSTTVTVDYATSSGTATSGTDFTAKTGTITFAPNAANKTISILTTNDSLSEDDETFFVTLSNVSSTAYIDNTVGTGTIVDNDD